MSHSQYSSFVCIRTVRRPSTRQWRGLAGREGRFRVRKNNQRSSSIRLRDTDRHSESARAPFETIALAYDTYGASGRLGVIFDNALSVSKIRKNRGPLPLQPGDRLDNETDQQVCLREGNINPPISSG
jgi:hypothetical protein